MAYRYFAPRLQCFGSPRSETRTDRLTLAPTPDALRRDDRQVPRQLARELPRSTVSGGREDDWRYGERPYADPDESSFGDDVIDVEDDSLSVDDDVLPVDDDALTLE
jgi:hypothetical protein